MTSLPQVWLVFAIAVHAVSYKGMESMARPLLGPKGELIDAGSDLEKNYFSE